MAKSNNEDYKKSYKRWKEKSVFTILNFYHISNEKMMNGGEIENEFFNHGFVQYCCK